MEVAWDQITSLMQEGTVSYYCDVFGTLLNKVKYSEEFSEDYVVYLFIMGLKPEIGEVLKGYHNIDRSLKLEEAFCLAKQRESVLGRYSIQGISQDFEFTKVEAAHKVFDETPNRFELEIQESIDIDDSNEDEKDNENNEVYTDLGNVAHEIDLTSDKLDIDDNSKKMEKDRKTNKVHFEVQEKEFVPSLPRIHGMNSGANRCDSEHCLEALRGAIQENVYISKSVWTDTGWNNEKPKNQGINNGPVPVIIYDDANGDVGCNLKQLNQTKMRSEPAYMVSFDGVNMLVKFKAIYLEMKQKEQAIGFLHDITYKNLVTMNTKGDLADFLNNQCKLEFISIHVASCHPHLLDKLMFKYKIKEEARVLLIHVERMTGVVFHLQFCCSNLFLREWLKGCTHMYDELIFKYKREGVRSRLIRWKWKNGIENFSVKETIDDGVTKNQNESMVNVKDSLVVKYDGVNESENEDVAHNFAGGQHMVGNEIANMCCGRVGGLSDNGTSTRLQEFLAVNVVDWEGEFVVKWTDMGCVISAQNVILYSWPKWKTKVLKKGSTLRISGWSLGIYMLMLSRSYDQQGYLKKGAFDINITIYSHNLIDVVSTFKGVHGHLNMVWMYCFGRLGYTDEVHLLVLVIVIDTFEWEPGGQVGVQEETSKNSDPVNKGSELHGSWLGI